MKIKLIVNDLKFELIEDDVVVSGEIRRSDGKPHTILEGEYEEVCDELTRLILKEIKWEVNLGLMGEQENSKIATKSIGALSTMISQLAELKC